MTSRIGIALLATLIGFQLWSNLFSQSGRELPFAHAAISSNPAPLQVLSSQLPTGVQSVVIVDPSSRVLSVYHITPQDGKIQLRSVRNVAWDLAMEEFNGTTPLPSELRQIR